MGGTGTGTTPVEFGMGMGLAEGGVFPTGQGGLSGNGSRNGRKMVTVDVNLLVYGMCFFLFLVVDESVWCLPR